MRSRQRRRLVPRRRGHRRMGPSPRSRDRRVYPAACRRLRPPRWRQPGPRRRLGPQRVRCAAALPRLRAIARRRDHRMRPRPTLAHHRVWAGLGGILGRRLAHLRHGHRHRRGPRRCHPHRAARGAIDRLHRAPRLALTTEPQRLRHLGRRRQIVVLAQVVDPAPRLLRLLRAEVVPTGDPRAAIRHQLADPIAGILHEVRADHAPPEPGRRDQPELDRRRQHRLTDRLVLRERQPVDLEQARQVVLARGRVDPFERRPSLCRAHQVPVRPLRQRVLRGL